MSTQPAVVSGPAPPRDSVQQAPPPSVFAVSSSRDQAPPSPNSFALLDRARPQPDGTFLVETETASVTVGPSELVALRSDARTIGDGAAREIDADLEVLVDAYEAQQEIDGEQPVAAAISKSIGEVEQFEDELRETLGFAKAALGRYRVLSLKGELGLAMEALEAAELAVRTADRAWASVLDGIEGGSTEAIETLEHTRNASALTVGLLAVVASGGSAAAMLTAGANSSAIGTAAIANGVATAAPALAALGEAGARLHAGLPVDWARLGKDAAMDVLLSRFGGRVANGVFDRLAGHPALRGMTRVVFARVVSTVLAHEGTTAVSTTVDHLFEAARGKPATWAQLADQLAARLTDPKGVAISAIFGAIAAPATQRKGQGIPNDELGGTPEVWPARADVNPRRRLGKTGRTKNCGRCAIALDAALAGRPATALPGGPLRGWEVAAALGRSRHDWFHASAGRLGVTHVMRLHGRDSQAIVFGMREDKLGHFFNVVNREGRVHFLDGQTHTTEIDWDSFDRVFLLVTRSQYAKN